MASNAVPIVANTIPAMKPSIDDSMSTLNTFAKNTALSFQVDDSTGSVVIKVVDIYNLQTICQMPTEQALIISQALKNNSMNYFSGLLVNTTI